MKKHLLLLSFAGFLFVGSQLSFAQTKAEQQKIAIEKAEPSAIQNADKVIQLLERNAKLEATQKNKVYDIFMSVDKKMQAIDAITDSAEREAKQAKMQAYINQKLQHVLTEKQYEIYKKKMTN